MKSIDPKLNLALFNLVGSKELVDLWWNSPNKAFYLAKPIDVYITTPELVTNYILEFSQYEGS